MALPTTQNDEPRAPPARGEVREFDPAEAKAIAYAQRVLFSEGPAAISMTAAIAASGVSRRTLYKRFPTREALLRAAIQEVLDSTYREITRNDEYGDSFRERLRDLATAFIRRREMFNRLIADPAIRDLPFYELVIGLWLKTIETRVMLIIKGAQQRGELARAYDPGLGAFAVWGVVRALIEGSFAGATPRKYEDFLPALDFVLNGLLSTVHREPVAT